MSFHSRPTDRWRFRHGQQLLGLLVLLSVASPAAGQTTPRDLPDRPSLREVVRWTLLQQPEIKLAEQQVVASRGALQQALGQFDFTLEAGISQRGDYAPISPLQQLTYGNPNRSLNTYTTNYYASASKQFSWGMTTSLSIQINRVDQNALLASYAQSVLVFSVVQPLLHGRGAESTAAAERAAKLQQEASQLQLRHVIAARLRDSCIGYWNYAAAHKSVERWVEAEERAKRLLLDEQRLVQAGEHPASSLKLLTANLSEVAVARADAERQRLEAQQGLGLAMGLRWEQLTGLGPPSDDFVAISADGLPSDRSLQALIQAAWERRPDLLAASTTIRTNQVLVRAAQRALQPQLDAEVDLGYAGLAEGSDAGPFFTAPYQNVAGVNFFAGLSLKYPAQNNAARGAAVQRQAEQARAVLTRDNLQRQIGAAVALLAGSLRIAVHGLESSEATVAAYQDAVEDERKKVRAGLSTIFELVQVQTRLNSSEQSALSARARVATLICQARFETGTLLTTHGADFAINLDQLSTFPGTAGPQD